MAEGPDQRVYLETFGCQMNVLDSQLVQGQLQGLGYRFVDDWRQADVVLYNTCAVRERAEQKVWSRIGEVGVYKRRQRPDLVLGVIGCMAERDGEDMVRRYPQVDLLCGPSELDKVPMLIDNAMKTGLADRSEQQPAGIALQGNAHWRSRAQGAAPDQLERIDLGRSFPSQDQLAGGRSAYVRITRGCNKFCTYCVVPFTRGREVHRPPQHVLDECRRLVEGGVQEITLLGQTVNHYHYDHDAEKTFGGIQQPQVGSVVEPNRGTGGPSPQFGASVMRFSDLLARIHDTLPELRRLRFITSFPRDFGDDILKVMAKRPRICRYLHIPVQSGSNRILKAMNRGYTVEEYQDLVQRIRTYLPDAEIATDIICGFPSETEADHRATAELLRWCRFKGAFVFQYSPRPGTAAYKRLPDDVPKEVKKRRNNELLSLQSEISREVNEQYVGQRVPVFVESVSAKARKRRSEQLAASGGGNVVLHWEPLEEVTQLMGRTRGDVIVCFDGAPELIGYEVIVEIQRATPLTLFGRLVEPSLATA